MSDFAPIGYSREEACFFMNDDLALLRRYSNQGCEESFRTVVERHLPLVYAAALRQVGGDRHLAEDICQHVFGELARCSGRLSAEVIVAGWLYRTTAFTAAKVVRSERRRRAHEAAAVKEQASDSMSSSPEGTGPDWESLSAELDAVMNRLPEPDRNAILLRFFQRLDYRAVGEALHVSDDTAQKRVSRALERLRKLLLGRGVALSGTALGALLARNAAAAPPASLTAQILTHVAAGGAALGVSAGGALSHTFLKLMAAKTVWGAAVALLAVAAFAWRNIGNSSSTLPPGLVSWWTADGNTLDRKGANHGFIEGNVTYAPGRFGQAFRFDGREGTHVRVPSSASLTFTNALTIEFWFRPDEDSIMGSLLMKRTEDTNATASGNLVNYGFSMGRIHPDHQYGICQFFNDPEERGGYHARVGEVSLLESLVPQANLPGASNRFSSKDNLFEQAAFFPTSSRDLSVLRGHWHHLAGTFRQLDGNRVRMTSYFDGEKRNQIVLFGRLANTVNDAPLSIGGFPTSPFKGCIDEIRIFNRELGAREVKALFHLAPDVPNP